MNLYKNIIIFVFFSALLLSCNTEKKIARTTLEAMEPIAFNTIKSGENSSYETPQNIQIHTLSELENIWHQLYKNYSRKEPLPQIDFENKMLIMISMGEQNSGGHSIEVNTISENKENIVVMVDALKPGNECITTENLSYPFQLVEIPKTSKKIIYNKVTKIYNCEE